MKKTVRIGTVCGCASFPVSLFATIQFAEGRLSISGVEGPKSNGDAHGSCGQIDMHPWDVAEYAPGWDATKVAQFRDIWATWHLNDMRSGSPAQRAFLKTRPNEERDYTRACEALAAAGINPDPNYMHEGKPYSYGSAWLRDELPADVVQFLQSLPDADKPLPAAWAR